VDLEHFKFSDFTANVFHSMAKLQNGDFLCQSYY